MTIVRFTVPGEPQGKGRARIGKVGGFSRLFTPAKTLAYEGLVAQMAQEAMAGAALIEGPASVSCELLFSVPRSASKKARAQMLAGELRPTKKPDADNVLKALCDGMNGVVWRDDVQAVDVRVVKRYAEVPGVVVAVQELQAGLVEAAA
jgi:Holliday junction resolvase RusA-like endonuclease